MIQIKRWYNGEIIHQGPFKTIKECAEDAVKKCISLAYADFELTDLESAYLRSADLRSANLRSANLESANLESADLESAYLRSADLRSANLRSSDLSSSDLSSANLRSAYLRTAYLESAKLTNNIKIKSKKYAYYQGSDYYCMFFGSIIKIGCEVHYYKDWEKFTDKEILAMDGPRALKFWKREKNMILSISKKLQNMRSK